MTGIVVDKSFLQGASGERIRELAQNDRILMSDTLLYELLTTRPEARTQCFAKFPNVQNPVDLINHVGILMRRELETRQPSGKPSLHKEDLKFLFNSALLDPEYRPPADAQEAIDEETARLKESVQSFLAKAETIELMFPGLLRGSQAERDAAHLGAEKAIVAPNALLPFISQFTFPPGETPLPPATRINEKWALYRWVQVQLLFTLDVYVRYQGKIPEPLTPRLYEKMEHDVLDVEQLILGCLEGSFATRESKHKRWWALLCKEGYLYE